MSRRHFGLGERKWQLILFSLVCTHQWKREEHTKKVEKFQNSNLTFLGNFAVLIPRNSSSKKKFLRKSLHVNSYFSFVNWVFKALSHLISTFTYC